MHSNGRTQLKKEKEQERKRCKPVSCSIQLSKRSSCYCYYDEKKQKRQRGSTGLPDDHLAVAVALEMVPAVPPAARKKEIRDETSAPARAATQLLQRYPMGGAEPRPLASMLRRCASSTCTTLPPATAPAATAATTSSSSSASLAADEPRPPAIAPLLSEPKPSYHSRLSFYFVSLAFVDRINTLYIASRRMTVLAGWTLLPVRTFFPAQMRTGVSRSSCRGWRRSTEAPRLPR
jgi:hypothetical protein